MQFNFLSPLLRCNLRLSPLTSATFSSCESNFAILPHLEGAPAASAPALESNYSLWALSLMQIVFRSFCSVAPYYDFVSPSTWSKQHKQLVHTAYSLEVLRHQNKSQHIINSKVKVLWRRFCFRLNSEFTATAEIFLQTREQSRLN